MKFVIIVAIGRNGEIGKNNEMLWHLPREMQFFKATTMGHTVLMGRKTWDSLPEKFRPLPGRKNIVVTNNLSFNAKNITVIHHIEKIRTVLNKDETCFIIGGEQIFKWFLEHQLVSEMYITQINESFPDATVFFPELDTSKWKQELIFQQKKDAKNQYDFEIKKFISNSD